MIYSRPVILVIGHNAMLFIHPMWDNESQRIGMRKCWALAYIMHDIGEGIGFLGLLSLVGAVGYMIYAATFDWLVLCIALGMGAGSEMMVQLSWIIVAKRGFEYDYEKREASWIENGKRVTYRYTSDAAGP